MPCVLFEEHCPRRAEGSLRKTPCFWPWRCLLTLTEQFRAPQEDAVAGGADAAPPSEGGALPVLSIVTENGRLPNGEDLSARLTLLLPDGTEFLPCDPGIFCDEDGRLYLYANALRPLGGITNGCSQIVGYELDPEQPCRVIRGPVVLLEMNPEAHIWERYGSRNQHPAFGWVEGPHLLKHQGRYYLIFASPNTQYKNYSLAVAYSDCGPLDGFQYQKRNPLTHREDGIVTGPGHGSVEHGPDNSLWVFYTVVARQTYQFERRIGMDRVSVDENGELYCPLRRNGYTAVRAGSRL